MARAISGWRSAHAPHKPTASPACSRRFRAVAALLATRHGFESTWRSAGGAGGGELAAFDQDRERLLTEGYACLLVSGRQHPPTSPTCTAAWSPRSLPGNSRGASREPGEHTMMLSARRETARAFSVLAQC